MIDLDKQNELFDVIGKKLRRKIACYVVGGSAMLYYDMKGTTKYIDLVFDTNEERDEIEEILKNLKYKEKDTRILYFRKKNKPIMLEREEIRFDLFIKKVVVFEITNSIKDRIESVYEFDNLIVKVISPEDIILLKCATERAGDRLDAVEIIKKKDIKWDVIIEEALNQTKLEEYLFPVFLFDFLCELKEDLKAEIPKKVLDKIREIGEELLVKKLGKD